MDPWQKGLSCRSQILGGSYYECWELWSASRCRPRVGLQGQPGRVSQTQVKSGAGVWGLHSRVTLKVTGGGFFTNEGPYLSGEAAGATPQVWARACVCVCVRGSRQGLGCYVAALWSVCCQEPRALNHPGGALLPAMGLWASHVTHPGRQTGRMAVHCLRTRLHSFVHPMTQLKDFVSVRPCSGYLGCCRSPRREAGTCGSKGGEGCCEWREERGAG